MRVPVVIPVAGKKVRLLYKEVLEDNAYALVAADRLTIDVSKTRNISPTDVWRSILHELAHVALDFSGHCKWLKEPQEEAIVHSFEVMLGPILVLAPVKGIRWREVRFPFEE